MKTIKVNINNTIGNVPRDKYVRAKTKQLKAFGYSDLTEKEVDDQVTALRHGGELTVIGRFMEDEVLPA